MLFVVIGLTVGIKKFRGNYEILVKVGLSPSKKKILFICFNKNSLKIMKNTFYFILKAFVLKIFIFLSGHFEHVEETA